jgi:hypothetical protein
MEKYLAPFDITLDDSDYVTFPKLGKIGRYGNGILLFEKTKQGSRLTLLADTPEDLVSLIKTIASGSLSACVLQDNIGICSVGFGGSYSTEGSATPEPAKEGGATPVPTSTPGG